MADLARSVPAQRLRGLGPVDAEPVVAFHLGNGMAPFLLDITLIHI
ncbi:hypothetical protein [Gemmobacter caeruleus]|nr:hypothetical protein [Gemmobacter caeruleus]